VFQQAISKESLGDVYKKMKRYKQASKCYNDSMTELQKILKNKSNEFYKRQSEKIQHFQQKLKMKQAMCCYYQGQTKKAILNFEELVKFYHKFDPTNIKVQNKNMKCNFYFAKSMLSVNEKDQEGKVDYLQALTKLTYCANEEIDPELHELYSGNAHFEIFKIFIKQKDIYNAHEYLQKATDNNFNSKRLSLYRDFTEGVVYLMKRKIKKGV
jgi:tetratricopeptide (TPR) repeat protein